MFELHNVSNMLAAFIEWQDTYPPNAESTFRKTIPLKIQFTKLVVVTLTLYTSAI